MKYVVSKKTDNNDGSTVLILENIETGNEKPFILKTSEVSSFHEGDVVDYTEQRLEYDEKSTKERKNKIQEKFNRLARRSK